MAVIEQRHAVLAQMLAQFGAVQVTVAGDFQEERAIMTAVRDMKHAAGFGGDSPGP